MSLVDFINLVIGLLGLIGLYFTYISFVNPIGRFNRYLRKPAGWEKFLGVEMYTDIYRYKKYPSFQIVIDWNKELVNNFHESWINDALFPDKTNNCSYHAQIGRASCRERVYVLV